MGLIVKKVKESPYLTLSEAQKTGRLADFAAQEEARGIGPADRDDFKSALGRVITAPPEQRLCQGGKHLFI
jgi:hypothetical protein